MNATTFLGRATIAFDPVTAAAAAAGADNITLHARGLILDGVSVYAAASAAAAAEEEEVEVSDVWESGDERNFLVIRLGRLLREGEALRADVAYTGPTDQKPAGAGFYLADRYREDGEDGEETFTWATKFEPGYARQMFPCLDEPRLRAVFTLWIGRPREYMSISNMPKVRGTPVHHPLSMGGSKFLRGCVRLKRGCGGAHFLPKIER